MSKFRISVCRGAECAGKRDGDAVHERLARLIDERALHEHVVLDRHSCFGRCRVGPNVHVRPQPAGGDQPRFVLASMPPRQRGRSALYNGVSTEDAVAIIDAHILGGEILHRLIHRPAPVPPDDRGPGEPRLVEPLATIDLSSHDSTDTESPSPPTGDTSDAGD